MDIADLRVALFSGNYNYVRDGANQALNRLVDYLLRQGAALRVYAPKVENPAFPPTGDLFGIPAVPIPCRSEYRFPLGLWRAANARTWPSSRPTCSTSPRPTSTAHAALQLGRGSATCRCSPRSTPASTPIRAITAWRFIEPWFERHHAALLPSLRRAGRAVREHGRGAARARHERRHRHLVARGRPRDLRSRPARPRLAPLARHRRRRSGDRLPRPAW